MGGVVSGVAKQTAKKVVDKVKQPDSNKKGWDAIGGLVKSPKAAQAKKIMVNKFVKKPMK